MAGWIGGGNMDHLKEGDILTHGAGGESGEEGLWGVHRITMVRSRGREYGLLKKGGGYLSL